MKARAPVKSLTPNNYDEQRCILSSMERPSGLATMAPAMEEARNYNAWIYSILRPCLGHRILEIGPGFGGIASHVIEDRKEYYAIDVDPNVILRLRAHLGLGEDKLAIGDISSSKWIEYFKTAGVDTVVMINVLEHLQDDLGMVKSAARCAPNGRLTLMVPAVRWLYGSLDIEAGHYRRYSQRDVLLLLNRSGCAVRRLSYINAIGAAAWFLSAKILKLKLNSEETNNSVKFYDHFVVPIARRFDPLLNWLCGQSLIAAADLP